VFQGRLRQFGVFLLVFLPVALAVAAMLLNTSRMLDGIAESVNKQEEDRVWQAVQSAFQSEGNALANTISDNANWHDAAIHAYGPTDDEWIDSV
jgi:sensor domain CHASE-containing protein